jgi:hypothetical protein
MSILDSVEPDAWAREWEGDDSDLGQYCVVFHEDEKDDNQNWFQLYSRETVESLIASLTKGHEQRMVECRKQVLLELADTLDEKKANFHSPLISADELRRMAESTKGER